MVPLPVQLVPHLSPRATSGALCNTIWPQGRWESDIVSSYMESDCDGEAEYYGTSSCPDGLPETTLLRPTSAGGRNTILMTTGIMTKALRTSGKMITCICGTPKVRSCVYTVSFDHPRLPCDGRFPHVFPTQKPGTPTPILLLSAFPCVLPLRLFLLWNGCMTTNFIPSCPSAKYVGCLR